MQRNIHGLTVEYRHGFAQTLRMGFQQTKTGLRYDLFLTMILLSDEKIIRNIDKILYLETLVGLASFKCIWGSKNKNYLAELTWTLHSWQTNNRMIKARVPSFV